MSPSTFYLLAIEDVLRSPLIQAQVFPLLQHLAATGDVNPRLVSLYPAMNWWHFRSTRQQLAQDLARVGVDTDILPLAFLTRHFHIPRRLLPWYKWQVSLASLWLTNHYHPALIHARSYPAALAGFYLKQRSDARLLFDTRSLYVEEGAVVTEGGKRTMFGLDDVAAWKEEEACLMAAADAITVVSAPMVDILAARYPRAASKIHLVPIATPVPPLETLHRWRTETRRKLGIDEDAWVITYVGSWFEPELTLPVIERLVKGRPDARWELLLLVANTPANLSDILTERLGTMLPFHHLHLPHEKIFSHLAAADLAVLPQADAEYSSQPAYELRARSVLSIKFTEYLACGLPVLVSRHWAGAAADIVAENELGLVYDGLSCEEMATWLHRWQQQRLDFHYRAWAYASRHFAQDVVFYRYRQLYHDLLSADF